MMDPLGSINSAGNYRSTIAAVAGVVTENRQPAGQAERSGISGNAVGIRLPEDRVTLSGQQPERGRSRQQTAEQEKANEEPSPGEKTTPAGTSLEDPQVQQQISRLKQIEQKVKAHEAAHKAVGGNLASSASYSYTQGPDGRSYVTGGEVQIDMSGGRTPQETISKMQQVIRAALAPSDPSAQDRAVAAQAATQMAQAQQEKMQAANPSAEPDPTQPVDPVKEALRQALNPEASEDTSRPKGADNRIQQAYGNPAVQRSNRSAADQNESPLQAPSTMQQTSFSQSSGNSLVSSFA
jgi:hypothetical protein